MAPSKTSSTRDNSSDETEEKAMKAAPAKTEPATAEQAESTAVDTATTESSSDVAQQPVVTETGITISVHILDVQDPLKLQVLEADLVQDVIQWVYELPHCYHITNGVLRFNGKRLNNQTPFSAIEGFKENSEFHLGPDSYTQRQVYAHINRMLHIFQMKHADTVFNGGPSNGNYSPSLLSALQSETPVIDASVRLQNIAPRISNFYYPMSFSDESKYVRSIAYSTWNPPNSNRQLAGDLAYLVVETLEKKTYQVTANSRGFFVNRSNNTKFNPERNDVADIQQHLVGLLRKLSPKFLTKYKEISEVDATQQSVNTMYELSATPYRVNSWIIPTIEHKQDAYRATTTVTPWTSKRHLGEGSIEGPLFRDWNEEYQSLRELPRETIVDRILRDRALFKFNNDFVTAATAGAIEIVHKNIAPMNPMDEPRGALMFLWNNIFFSFAADARDQFQKVGGQDAAHASAANDLRGVRILNNIDDPDLNTLATVVIDYGGYRIVGQSLLPGILRQQASAIVYGSVDAGKTLEVDESLGKVLGRVCQIMHLKPHKVCDDAGKEYVIPTSVECKGVLGSDGRRYVLDLYRMAPADPTFCESHPKHGSRHQMYLYRIELVKGYFDDQYLKMMGKKVAELRKEQRSEKEVKAEPTESKVDEKDQNGAVLENGAGQTEAEKAAQEAAEAQNAAKREREILQIAIKYMQEQEGEFLLNPDVFTPASLGGTQEEQDADKALVKEIGTYLEKKIIPSFVESLLNDQTSPVDVFVLRDVMHSKGINMRYLGIIAQRLEGVKEKYFRNLCVSEMIARAAKHHFRLCIRDLEPHHRLDVICQLLNCLLGRNVQQLPTLDGLPELQQNLNSNTFWSAVSKKVSLHFRYTLKGNPLKSYNVNRLALLRSICKKVGIQVSLREYNFTQAAAPFTTDDIVRLYPVVKHSEPRCNDGQVMFQNAQTHLKRGVVKETLEYLSEAVGMFQQVYGPLHASVAACYRDMSLINIQCNRISAGLELQEKATMILERVFGVDHAETICSYAQLAMCCLHAEQRDRAFALLCRAKYLTSLIGGADHRDNLVLANNMARCLLFKKLHKLALSLLEAHKVKLPSKDIKREEVTTSVGVQYELLAQSAWNMGDYRGAVAYMQLCHAVFSALLGDDHPKTKQSYAMIHKFTTEAVERAQLAQKNGHKELPNDYEPEIIAMNDGSPKGEDTRPINDLMEFINKKKSKAKRKKKSSKKKTQAVNH